MPSILSNTISEPKPVFWPIHLPIARSSNLPLLATLDTLQQLASQPRTSCKVRTRPVSCLLQLDNSQLAIFDKFRGEFVHFTLMMVIHGGLVLVSRLDMQLLVFVQEVE